MFTGQLTDDLMTVLLFGLCPFALAFLIWHIVVFLSDKIQKRVGSSKNPLILFRSLKKLRFRFGLRTLFFVLSIACIAAAFAHFHWPENLIEEIRVDLDLSETVDIEIVDTGMEYRARKTYTLEPAFRYVWVLEKSNSKYTLFAVFNSPSERGRWTIPYGYKGRYPFRFTFHAPPTDIQISEYIRYTDSFWVMFS